MVSYIYLIMMADGVYKVGRTQQDYGNHLKRLKSYPADSQIVYVRRTNGGDWTCSVTDYEVPNKSGEGALLPTGRSLWVQYRAALRDVTLQSDPFAIVWPVAPL